ncbi:DUF1801 domain-containing protein [Spongiivirga sp. MCCC 1A20706]|uniref:DUF1801 domain-containing protein n=1 Tax=Spongiivirga sp. MCCC 1A20706 TaxID=3160963 RepID=UPI003977CB66
MIDQYPEVKAVIDKIGDAQKEADCKTLFDMMSHITKQPPKIWRGSMVGFGEYKYTQKNGREGRWFLTGFCQRKKFLVIYVIAGFYRYEALLKELGKFETGVSCLYVKQLADVDKVVLAELIGLSIDYMKSQYEII